MWLPNDDTLVEMRPHGTKITRLVQEAADAKLAIASQGFSAKQARVNGFATVEQQRANYLVASLDANVKEKLVMLERTKFAKHHIPRRAPTSLGSKPPRDLPESRNPPSSSPAIEAVMWYSCSWTPSARPSRN